MKQNLFWQTQLLHNVSSALAMGTKHTSARTKLCVVPVEASMKGEPAKFLNSFSSQNAATAEELTQPGPVSVQYARKQPRRQEKHGTHAQENMRSQQLPLFQLYNPPPVMFFPLSQSLPEGKKRKTAEPSRSSERLRGALPEVQILSSRSANSGGKLPANSFKIFDAEMSA